MSIHWIRSAAPQVSVYDSYHSRQDAEGECVVGEANRNEQGGLKGITMTARTKNLEMTVMLINSVLQPNPAYNTGRYWLSSVKVGVRRMYTLHRWTSEDASEK